MVTCIRARPTRPSGHLQPHPRATASYPPVHAQTACNGAARVQMTRRIETLVDFQPGDDAVVAIVALDADQHFRQINRDDGRSAGDTVLAAVRESLDDWEPPPVVVRQDGDNFVAAFVDVELEAIVQHAATIRRSFADKPLLGVSRPLDVRIGIALGRRTAPVRLVELAEAALTLAQTKGSPIEVADTWF